MDSRYIYAECTLAWSMKREYSPNMHAYKRPHCANNKFEQEYEPSQTCLDQVEQHYVNCCCCDSPPFFDLHYTEWIWMRHILSTTTWDSSNGTASVYLSNVWLKNSPGSQFKMTTSCASGKSRIKELDLWRYLNTYFRWYKCIKWYCFIDVWVKCLWKLLLWAPI